MAQRMALQTSTSGVGRVAASGTSACSMPTSLVPPSRLLRTALVPTGSSSSSRPRWGAAARPFLAPAAAAAAGPSGPGSAATAAAAAAGAAGAGTAQQGNGKMAPEDVVAAFYRCVNAKDVGGAIRYIAEDCEYQDFTYPEPKRGRAAIQSFLQDVSSFVPDDLVYIIDDVTVGDDAKVGVVWHVELDGKPFPNACGCSFYRTNARGEIEWARDIVESPLKLGDNAIQLLGVLAPLVRKFGPEGPSAPALPLSAALIWAAYAFYAGSLFFADYLPGPTGLQTPPETFQTLLNMSINFGYVNVFAQWADLPVAIPAGAEHPSYEALFNTINMWSLMLLPAILADRRSEGIPNRGALWVGIFFATNLFAIPYMALRAAQPPLGKTAAGVDTTTKTTDKNSTAAAVAPQLPPWSPVVGWSSLAILGASAVWGTVGRPEFGGLAERWVYLQGMFEGDRVFWAFCLDAALYCVWQWVLMEGAPTKLRTLPFVGLAAWLIGAGRGGDVDGGNGGKSKEQGA